MPNVTYPVDITGIDPANRVVDEVHVLSEINSVTYRIIVPLFAPFYLDNLVLKHVAADGSVVILRPDVDYSVCLPYIGGARSVGKMIYGGITINTDFLNGVINVTYQTLGGDYTADSIYVLNKLAEMVYNPRTTLWDIVTDKQQLFPPTPHAQHLDTVFGQQQLIDAINSLATTIILSGADITGTDVAVHLADKATNPHQVTATQIGLGDVANLPLALPSEVAAMQPAQKYVTLTNVLGMLEMFKATLDLTGGGGGVGGAITSVTADNVVLNPSVTGYTDTVAQTLFEAIAADIISAKNSITSHSTSIGNLQTSVSALSTSVKKVNNTLPDVNGNVDVIIPASVKTINSVSPDVNGNFVIDTTASANPIGTVISSVSAITPEGYLDAAGGPYLRSAYPTLANFTDKFNDQLFNFTDVTVTGFTAANTAVIWFNNLWIMTSGTSIYTSPDGISWTSRITASVTFGQFGDSLAVSSNLCVCVGPSGTILSSSDGITWVQRTSGTTNNLTSVAYGNNLWVAAGVNGTILTSPDGITWTVKVTTFPTTDQIYSVAYGNNLWVACGFRTKFITSVDGNNWSAVSQIDPTSTSSVTAMTYGNARWVASSGNGGRTYISTNGINWKSSIRSMVSATSVSVSQLVCIDGIFYCATSAGKILYSLNGENWIQCYYGFGNNTVCSIAGNPNGTILACSNSYTTVTMAARTYNPLTHFTLVPYLGYSGYSYIKY